MKTRPEDDSSRSSGLLTLARKLWKAAAERPQYEMYACMYSMYARTDTVRCVYTFTCMSACPRAQMKPPKNLYSHTHPGAGAAGVRWHRADDAWLRATGSRALKIVKTYSLLHREVKVHYGILNGRRPQRPNSLLCLQRWLVSITWQVDVSTAVCVPRYISELNLLGRAGSSAASPSATGSQEPAAVIFVYHSSRPISQTIHPPVQFCSPTQIERLSFSSGCRIHRCCRVGLHESSDSFSSGVKVEP